MNKRFSFVFTITFVIVYLAFVQNQTSAQYFNKYYTWASEKHLWPGEQNGRLPFLYSQVKYALKGNFSGFQYHSVDIPALVYLVKDTTQRLYIYTVESRGYRIKDPIIAYDNASVVSQQEGIGLDSLWYTNKKGDSIYVGAYTDHPTLRRFRDQNNTFPFVDSIKFAVSGNFFGGRKDEIAVVYNNPNGQQQFYFFKVNQEGDTLNYQFVIDDAKTFERPRQIDSIDISYFTHVLSGNFDSDPYDEIVIFNQYVYNSEHNKSYLLDWNAADTVWNITLLHDDPHWIWNNKRIVKAAVGNFCEDGRDDIACFYSYGDEPTSLQRILIMSPSYTWFSGIAYETTKSAFDWSKISHVVAGNFDNDTTNYESLAIFYDPGTSSDTTGAAAVQKVYFTDQGMVPNSTPWALAPKIFEHRSNLSFNKDSLKFVEAGNFDYDVKGRDDLLGIYMAKNSFSEGDSYNYKKALLWTCLPPFEENDFIMETMIRDSVSQPPYMGKFIPLGVFDTRLVSDYKINGVVVDSLILDGYTHDDIFTPAYFKGRLRDEDIDKYASVFNTAMASRECFTDHNMLYTNRIEKVNSGYEFYDHYLDGFLAYRDKAYQKNLKFLVSTPLNSVRNFDNELPVDTLLKKFSDFSSFSTFPKYYRDILDSGGNHPAILGWYYVDEPSGAGGARRPNYNQFDPESYQYHFLHNALTKDTVYYEDFVRMMHNFSINSKPKTQLPKFLCLNHVTDLDFYADDYEIGIYDLYPFNINWDDEKQQWVNAREFHNLTIVPKFQYQSMVRNNQEAAMFLGIGFGWQYNVGFMKRPSMKDSLWYSYRFTPTLEDFRYSVFGPAIEGLRGHIYFIGDNLWSNDTVSSRVFLVSSEFKSYYPIFNQKPLNTRISCNMDRFNQVDYVWDGAVPQQLSRFINYSLIKDSIDNIYYLFVSDIKRDIVMPVQFTIFIDSVRSSGVYELAQDFHKNGMNDAIPSQLDNSGKYYTFTVNLKYGDIKIYTIGGLPQHHKRTIADSVGLKGYLSYSNQRKLIAYPARQNSNSDYGSTDTVRYHAVYHKIIPGTGRWGVYYRRSKPMVRRYPQDMIDWEPTESLVSHTITVDPASPFGRDTLCDCKYPSLVVRYDSIGQIKPMTYIVYSCNKSTFDPSPYYSIVEKMLPANDSIQVNDSIGTIIATYPKCDFDKFGTPTINASYGGNYYAWSDSLNGINVGWKTPSATYLADTISLRWNRYPDFDTRVKATHPSLNSYSRIGLGEGDCAIVWQELDSLIYPPYPEGHNHIYYSRLRVRNNNIEPFLPNRFIDPNLTVTTNYQLTISKLTDTPDFPTYKTSTLPIVYRGIEDESDGYPPLPQDSISVLRRHYDRVYWQTQSRYRINWTQVFLRSIDMFDNNLLEPDKWKVYYPYGIKSLYNNVGEPTASQGCMGKYYDTTYKISRYSYQSDSILVLNVTNFQEGEYLPPNKKIWQINHGYWNIYTSSGASADTIEKPVSTYAKPIPGSGSHPQLAAMPAVLGRGEWLANRRLFETSFGTPPEIASSLQYFYKRSVEDTLKESSMPFLGFIRDSVPGMISRFRVTDEEKEISFAPTFETHKKKDHYYLPADTIVSNWFKMKDLSSISFYSFAKAPKFISLQLERKKDGHLTALPIEYRGDTAYVYHEYSFIGSKNDKYRIKVIKKSPETHYFEEMLIGGLNGGVFEAAGDTSGGILFRAGAKLYDLQSESENVAVTAGDKFDFSLYPNPAATEIFVRCNFPAEFLSHGDESIDAVVELMLYNSLGQGFGTYKSSLGGFVRIDVSGMQPGLYYVKGKIISENYVPETPPAAVSKPVIITR